MLADEAMGGLGCTDASSASLEGDSDVSDELQIERATLEDLDRLTELFEAYRAFYECEPAPERARAYLRTRLERDEAIVLNAIRTEGGTRTILGFTQLYPTWESLEMGPMFVLYDLFVDPAGRGLGIGRALLDAGVAYAKEHDAVVVMLETSKTNTVAKSLYESAGWKLEREFDTYLYELDGS